MVCLAHKTSVIGLLTLVPMLKFRRVSLWKTTWIRGFDDLRQLWLTGLGIPEAVIIMRTKNELPRFRDALSFSALLLLLPSVYPAQPADRFLLSPPALQAGPLIEVEPQPGPQPPGGKDPIPAYPGLGEPAIVRSWSRSDLGRDWRPPACTGWPEVGFTT